MAGLKKTIFTLQYMVALLKSYLRKNAPSFTDEDLEDTVVLFKPKKIKKNTLIHNAGEECRYLYFITSGYARTYYITRQGQEKTRYVGFAGSICTPLAAFISNQPSFEYMDAPEGAELLSIARADFYELVSNYPAWKEFYIQLLEQAYIYQNVKIETLVTLTAKQRYTALLEQNPVFVRRLSNKILAGYLGISQETLSRLKKD